MLFRAFYPSRGQLGLHGINAVHAGFDCPHGLEVFIELPLVAGAQATLQTTCVVQGQVGNVAETGIRLSSEQSVVDLAWVPHRRRNVPGSVPGHIVEVNRFDVVLVVVAAQFKRRIRRFRADAVSGNVVERASERVCRVSNFVRSNTCQKAGRGLGVRVRSLLKISIEPGNQRDLLPHAV